MPKGRGRRAKHISRSKAKRAGRPGRKVAQPKTTFQDRKDFEKRFGKGVYGPPKTH